MNNRLRLSLIKDHVANNFSVPAVGNVHVGSAYDRQYMTDYINIFPAIWVAGQTLIPENAGKGFSGLNAQTVNVEIPFRIVVQRFASGNVDPEEHINLIHAGLVDVIKDWTPTGADSPFVWKSGRDGPATESLLVADLYFVTKVRYARKV